MDEEYIKIGIFINVELFDYKSLIFWHIKCKQTKLILYDFLQNANKV